MAEMEMSEMSLLVPKEFKEVVDFVAAILDDVKEKKEVGVIAVENLPGLMQAVEGYDQLAGVLDDKSRSDALAYMIKILADKLIPVKVD